MSTEMVAPHAPDRAGSQEPVSFEGALSQEVFGPFAQWPAQPQIDRHSESLLGPIHQIARDISVQHLARQPLAGAVPHALRTGQAPRPFDQPVVQHRRAYLEAHGHARPIHFHQDVIRQIRDQIAVHHPVADSVGRIP